MDEADFEQVDETAIQFQESGKFQFFSGFASKNNLFQECQRARDIVYGFGYQP